MWSNRLFELLLSAVCAVNFIPLPNIPEGRVFTVVPPATAPPAIVNSLSQPKLAADSHSCANNVAIGCPGVQLINNEGYEPTSNGCGPEMTGAFWDTFNS